MEIVFAISGVGTLVLLAVHLLDYFVESRQKTLKAIHLPAPNETVPAALAYQPMEAEYDHAA